MSKRQRLSVTVITLNEEHTIPACLQSVAWADEIIIVDSFSTDRTAELCRQYTDKVIQRQWPGHVRQKQYALEQASGDWILSLDADERLSPEATEEIRRTVLNGSPSADGFILPRQSYYLGRWIRHGGWYPDYKLRLVRRGTASWGGEDPHDKLLLTGRAAKLQGRIIHYVYAGISDQLRTVDAFSKITAEQWHSQGRRSSLVLMLGKPLARFLECYFWKCGFLDGMPGLIIAVITSYYAFLKFAKLWELQHATPRAQA